MTTINPTHGIPRRNPLAHEGPKCLNILLFMVLLTGCQPALFT
jgi:hypothetical protein